ncbi:hypothetical protein DXG01_004337 [Tephrocybe rancida]|nr:hypothetical protein DXG01_004337 [Tephrocybe rancida]
MVDALNTDDNPVRWEEVGVFVDTPIIRGNRRDGSFLEGRERHDYARRATLNNITWRIAQIIRHTYPLRLGDALKALECCGEMHKFLNPMQTMDYDPEGGSRDLAYDMETVGILTQGVIFNKKTGPRNFILGCSTLARLYRRLGRASEDQEMSVLGPIHRKMAR